MPGPQGRDPVCVDVQARACPSRRVLHLKTVFTKRDRTARLLGVANLLVQHSNGLTAPHIAEPNPGGHSGYVIGHDSVCNQVRTFKIERIDQAELTAETFEVPRDFDVSDRLRHAWGISDEETVHVRLRFVDAAAAKRVL